MTAASRPAALIPLTEPEHADLDVVAFPCAGSSPGQFQKWRALAPVNWRLTSACLPGHGPRAGEPFARGLTAAAGEIAAAITAMVPPARPLVLAGHSLGALIAFETARQVRPSALAVFACPPPPLVHRQGDTDVDWDESIIKLGGQDLPADLAAELIELYRPVYEADMEMLDAYVWDGGRVECDIWAVYSSEDFLPAVPWAGQTTGGADTVTLHGDHYLARDQPERAVCELVSLVDAQASNRADGAKRVRPCPPH